MTNSATPYDSRRPRAEVLADAVVSAYVHEISDRHRPAAPAAERPIEETSDR